MSDFVRPLLVVIRIILIGALVLAALAFGTLVALAIILVLLVMRLFGSRTSIDRKPAENRVFDAEFEIVRRPGRGVLSAPEHDQR